jgi:ribose 5-phosphate isomerase B
MAIAANKVPGVRAAVAWNEDIAKLSRQHNDANVLSLPARFVPAEEINKIVKAWLSTDFEGGRHERRVEKISQIEKDESEKD